MINLEGFDAETNEHYKRLSNVRGAVFANADKTAINILVHHSVHGDIPFTAASYDPEPHGRKIFQELLEGLHGEILPFTDSEFTTEQIKSQNTWLRNQRLNEASLMAFPLQSAINLGIATEQQRSQFETLQIYVVSLLNMTDEELQLSPAPFPTLAIG